MKRSTILFMVIGIFASAFAKATHSDGYQVTIKIIGMADTTCHIAYHYGNKQYYKDTVRLDANGVTHFEGKGELPGGIYLFVFPDKSYFEFIYSGDETHFSLETGRTDPVTQMKITGSPENEVFYGNLEYVNRSQNVLGSINQWLTANQKLADSLGVDYRTGLKDSLDLMTEKATTLSKNIQESRMKVIEEHPNSFYAKVINAMRDPEIPETPVDENGVADSTFPYRYFKQHYFDGVDFSDDRILRTPVYHNKVMHYMNKLTVTHPDSLCAAANYIIGKAKANKEVFKYTVIILLNKYANSKIMGLDAVYVCLVENYYATGQAYWADSVQVFRIVDRAKTLKPLLINKKAPNLIMMDIHKKWRELYKIDAAYTVLIFWDPDCGHCKKAMPKLKRLSDRVLDEDVEFYGVCTEVEMDKWKKFIEEKGLQDWIHVADPMHQTNFRSKYDISSTPKIFLLDKDKKIKAKGIGAEQLGDILDRYLQRDKEKKEKEQESD